MRVRCGFFSLPLAQTYIPATAPDDRDECDDEPEVPSDGREVEVWVDADVADEEGVVTPDH